MVKEHDIYLSIQVIYILFVVVASLLKERLRINSKSKFAFDAPGVLQHVVEVQVLIVVVPADDVQVVVVVEDVVGEGADLGQVRVALHQVRFHVELEAFLRSLRFVESSEDQNVF